MHLWLQAIYLVCASKKGISANQLHRTLGVTLKTAWYMGHRIREAMREGTFLPFGTNGGIVEADETFIGNEPGIEKGPEWSYRGWGHKNKVLSLLDRSTGRTRSMVIDSCKAKEIIPILQDNIEFEARIMTDDATQYNHLKDYFSQHNTVCHSKGEYVSFKHPEIHTNTVEGFFSIFKRGMKGVYQHCQKHHLHRYLAEFDFRYSFRLKNGYDDAERAEKLLSGVVGKRLTYKSANWSSLKKSSVGISKTEGCCSLTT